MRSRTGVCALAAVAQIVPIWAPSPRAVGGAAADKTDALRLEARKALPADSSACDAIRQTIALVYKTDAEGGPVVTSLCGVSAPKGFAWTCYVDGKPCKAVGRATLAADSVIEWKAEKAAEK